MTAIGRTILAAWKASSLYLYELSPSGFNLLRQVTGFTSGTETPVMEFLYDDSRLFLMRRNSPTTTDAIISLAGVTIASITAGNPVEVSVSKNMKYALAWQQSFTTGFNGIYITDAETMTNINSLPLYVTNVSMSSLHPKDLFAILGATSTTTYMFPKVNEGAGGSPIFNTTTSAISGALNARVRKTIPGLQGNVSAIEWHGTGNYLWIGDAGPYIHCMELITSNANDFTINNVISVALSYTPLIMKISPDNKYLAVSVNTGSQYLTYLYEVVGYNIIAIQTLTDFGAGLGWSGDSSLLIDALSKKAYRLDKIANTFVDASSIMANVEASLVAQAVSKHVMSSGHFGLFYDDARQLIISQSTSFDFDNLKFMLLDEDASFDPTETIASEVYSTFEVSGNGWPAGGKLLSNVAYATTSYGNSGILADNIEQIIDDLLTYRYGLLYDATNGIPIMWIDFQANVVVAKKSKLTFDFSSGLINISA